MTSTPADILTSVPVRTLHHVHRSAADDAFAAIDDWRDQDLSVARRRLRADGTMTALALDKLIDVRCAVRAGDEYRAMTSLIEAEELARIDESCFDDELELAAASTVISFGRPATALAPLAAIVGGTDDVAVRIRALHLLAEAAAHLGDLDDHDACWQIAVAVAIPAGPAAVAALLLERADLAVRLATANPSASDRSRLIDAASAAVEAAALAVVPMRHGRSARRLALIHGRSSRLKARNDLAHAAFERVVATGPSEPGDVDDLGAHARLGLAQVCIETGDLDAARAHGARGISASRDPRLELVRLHLLRTVAAVHDGLAEVEEADRYRELAQGLEERRRSRQPAAEMLVAARRRHDALRAARLASIGGCSTHDLVSVPTSTTPRRG